jgi:hypothetical protein
MEEYNKFIIYNIENECHFFLNFQLQHNVLSTMEKNYKINM